jgi:preprotein translocase subunit SecE
MKNKVSWPKYSQLQNSSILVLIASLIFALFIGLIDYVFQTGMDWFYGEF